MKNIVFVHGTLPDGVKEISRTKIFTEQTVPDKMRNQHRLARDTWGVLTVNSGALKFTLADSGTGIDLKQRQSLVIEPERIHFVTVTGPVSFDIAFYQRDEDAGRDMCCAGPAR